MLSIKGYKLNQPRFGLLALGVVFFVFLLLPISADAANSYCSSCSDCQSKVNNAGSGDTVYVSQNIFDYSGNICVEFLNKNNITLNCENGAGGKYYIIGYNTGTGIKINNSDYITVNNCLITGFAYGTHILDSYNTSISNTNIYNNNTYGILLNNSHSNIFTSLIASYNASGIYFGSASNNNIFSAVTANNNTSQGIYFGAYASSGNVINNLTANYNNAGVEFFNSDFSTLSHVTTLGNTNNGLSIYGADNSTFSNIKTLNNKYGIYFYSGNSNTFTGSVSKYNTTNDVYVSSGSSNSFFNNDFISKGKTYDNGTATMWHNGVDTGNHWDYYDESGDIDGNCLDAAAPLGRCDTAYSPIALKNTSDNFPKHISAVSSYYCNSCSDCNSKISKASTGNTVYLTNDITNASGNCLNFQNKQSITFDCQGYAIDGDATGNGAYFYNNFADGLNTLQNCSITDFILAVSINRSNLNTIKNNTIKNSAVLDVAISPAASANNMFYGNTFSNDFIQDNSSTAQWDNNAGIGNHWEHFDAESEGCSNAGGYCAGGFTLWYSLAIDRYPLYVGNTNQNTCNTCADCTAKITAASPGTTVKLTDNIFKNSGTCITFNAKNNVTFDCQKYLITGNSTNNGVYITGGSGNTVKNCIISKFDYGVYLTSTSGNFLENITSFFNDNNGYSFINSSSNTLTNLTGSKNLDYGLYLQSSGLNNFNNVNASYNNKTGVYITSNSNTNVFVSSTIKYNDSINTSTGVTISNSGGNTFRDSLEFKYNPKDVNIISDNGTGNNFYNNQFISKIKITDSSIRTKWDNNIDTGNWWQAYDASAIENCTDSNTNGICDTPYPVGASTQDRFPIWKRSADATYACSSCADCTNVIASALYGDKVVINSDIYGFSGANPAACIYLSNANGITLDGSDKILAGSGGYNAVSIAKYSEYNYIKNFNISGFDVGVKLADYSNNNVFSDIYSSYNTTYGISLNYSSYNNFLTINTSNNGTSGLYYLYANNNIINNLISTGNTSYGIQFANNNSNNTINNSEATRNGTDISITGTSSNNIFTNNHLISKYSISDTSVAPIYAGNWWEAYDTDSEGCNDIVPAGGNNICDTLYPVRTTPTAINDATPQYKGGTGTIYTCADCSDCNTKIILAQYGDTVELTKNIFGNTGNCITINNKQGLTFDCQNFNISGNYTGYGLSLIGKNNSDLNTIKNCKISQFNRGLFINKTNANTFINVSSFNNTSNGQGYWLELADYNKFINISAYNNKNNGYGIYFNLGSDYNEISLSSIYSNTYGIYYAGNANTNNKFYSNTIRQNQIYNIYINSSANNNVFYGNQFTSSEKIYINPSATGNSWVSGYLGIGNWWENYDTSGEGCYDDGAHGGSFSYANDNICDNGYTIKPGVYDAYPKYYGTVNEATCSNCGECNTAIENALYGDKVTLIQEITNADACINIYYKEGLTFDCNNKKITGTGGGVKTKIGINIDGRGKEKNIIKNCDISGFAYGIYANNSEYNTYQNIKSNFNNCTENNCDGSGIKILNPGTGNNTITGITVNNNEVGLYLQGSYNNNIINVTANNNTNQSGVAGWGGPGLRIGGNNNYLSDIKASYNGTNGLYLSGANSSMIYNANLQNNQKGLFIDAADDCIASSSIIKANTINVDINSASDRTLLYRNELTDRGTINDTGNNSLWDNGAAPSEGGNHWESFDSPTDCYMDGATKVCCTDAGSYCGNQYKINSVSIDRFPLISPTVPHILSCSSCSDCSAKILLANAGDTVELTKDIIFQSGNCIDFGSSLGVSFDCKDHTIIGMNTGYGIYMHSPGNKFNTVKNCYISYFSNGIYLDANSEYNIFTDLTLANNSSYAAKFSAGNQYNQFKNLNVSYNANGLDLAGKYNIFSDIIINNSQAIGISLGGENQTLKNILITNGATHGIYSKTATKNCVLNNVSSINNGRQGLVLVGAYNSSTGLGDTRDNIISSSTFKWNNKDAAAGTYDIYLFNIYSYNNTFYGNELSDKTKIWDAGTATKWNFNYQGNNWAGFDEDSEGCYDGNNNTYCDNGSSPYTITPYSLDADSVDNYPMRMTGLSNYYCNTCADCQIKISNATNGDTINIGTNLTTTSHCLNLSGKTNLSIDCKGNTITGPGGSTFNGIYSNGTGNHTVRNCIISNFNYGIYLNNSGSNTVTGNTIKTSTNKDIIISGTSVGNYIYNNDFANENKMSDIAANNTEWDNNSGVGNHWDAYDNPAEGCNDTAPADGICDNSYTITSSGKKDDSPSAVSVPSAAECNSCADCNTKIFAAAPGSTIRLINNITNTSGNCMLIDNKSNITFDCQDKIIDGTAANTGYGIKLNNSSYTTLKNCYIARFGDGVYLQSSPNSILEKISSNYNKNKGFYIESSINTFLKTIEASNNNNTAQYTYSYGIYINSSNYSHFDGITINNNKTDGFYISNSNFSNFTNINATNNGARAMYLYNSNTNSLSNVNIAGSTLDDSYSNYGLELYSSDNNTATSSSFKQNKLNIVLDSTSDNNKFYNNSFTSKYKISDNGTSNQWDNGTNAGNLWEAFDTDTIPEGCVNSSGICVADYEIKTGVFDRYPKYMGASYNNQNITCSSCDDCSAKIKNAYYGEVIKLDRDVANNNDCIVFPKYKEGVTFDGQNHVISGPGTTKYGIYVYGEYDEFINIKNATILGFERGVYIKKSDSVKIQNINSNLNSLYGIELAISDKAILSDIIANNNTSHGLYLSSNNSNLTNISTNGNSVGILIYGNNNILSNSINILNNTTSGLSLGGSSDLNTFTDGTYKYNKTDVFIPDNTSNSNLFYNNAFTSNNKINDNASDTRWDNGSTGNWWEAWDTGIEGCDDDLPGPGGNGICDAPYPIEALLNDNFPIYKGGGFNDQNITCASCSDCTTKIKNAYYGERVKLTQDLTTTDTCILFTNYSEGVTFDCDNGAGGNYNLIGDGTDYGIYFSGYGNSNNKAKNCNINNFYYGIYINGSYMNYLDNINSGYNSRGIYLYTSNNNDIKNITLVKNSIEVELNNSHYNIFNNLITTDPGYSSCSTVVGSGISFTLNATNNSIASSIIKYHATDIYLSSDSINNKFYNNYLVSKTKIKDLTVLPSKNNWYNGTTGNIWEAWDTAPEGCVNNGGICLAPYEVKTGVFDNYPKFVGTSMTTTCFNCADCNAKISAAQYGDTIKLSQDIINNSGTCLLLFNKQGLTIDGSGCTGNCKIKGTGTGNGIEVCGTNTADDNIRIQNFQLISYFNNGIYVNKARNTYINNIESDYNTKYGLYMDYTASSTLINITANNNGSLSVFGGGGIYFYDEYATISNSIFHNITANYNKSKFNQAGGIVISGAFNNKISSSTANYNQSSYTSGEAGGFNIYSSNNNIINSIIATNNTVSGGQVGGGISFVSSNNNQLSYATSTNNTSDGIYFKSSDDNILTNNTAQNNSNKFIYINDTSNKNIFYNNIFNSKNDITDTASDTRWNKYSSGNIKPGNRWYAYDSITDSPPCYDNGLNGGINNGFPGIGFDGYCDDHYLVNTTYNIYDEFPIKYSVMPTDFSITAAWLDPCNIRILWENNGDADTYRIYRSENSAAYSTYRTVDNTKNSFVDYIDSVNITIGNSYSYKVEAVNGIYSKYANCDRDGGTNAYCQSDGGNDTITLYPIICSTSLGVTTADDCATLDLAWSDKSPTNSYYIMRSVDGGINYYYSCSGATDPKFGICTTIRTFTDDDSASYTFNDDDTAVYTQFSYKIRNCLGSGCPGNPCKSIAGGPFVDCYVESNVASPICSLPPPTWKEIKP